MGSLTEPVTRAVTPQPEDVMSSYAVGLLRSVEMGPEIAEYLERIDATLNPFEGRFIIHGGEETMLEGTSPGTLVVIEFPSRAAAHGWYASESYQAIAPLRAEHSDSAIFLIDGVEPGHRATDVLRPTQQS